MDSDVPHDDLAQSENIWATGEIEPEHHVGDVIGAYEIKKVLGEGGYGMVYLAQQHQPVQRDVALKVLKAGMDSRSIVVRFEAERQTLAMMDHPGVAKVFDAGQTKQGRPFFVMEYVPGVPITRYCDQHRLGLAERLTLFVQVCQAVQHAHSKGIVHRDLKPGNILVCEVNGLPAPKVIDFGVAKALSTSADPKTVFTQQGQLIGTPEYMSPEQADLNEQDIDTRSDVYSLGVVLYELLTGLLPFQTSESTGLVQLQRMVREVDPPRPTTRMRDHHDAATRAKCRQLDHRALLQRVRGDLEWIVMKCLEKDRDRRYVTADALLTDIRRHLNNEPVLAGPPGAAYRFGKFARRNRAAMAAAVAIAAVLLISTIVSMGYAVREAEQRRLAQANETRAIEQSRRAERAAERALAAEAEATQRAEELRTVADFQRSMLVDIDVQLMGTRLREDIVSAGVASWQRAGMGDEAIELRLQNLEALIGGANFTTAAASSLDRNVLAHALQAINREFVDQPTIKAALLESVAETYTTLGDYETALSPRLRALALRRDELGDDHEDTVQLIHATGTLYRHLGRFDEAEKYLEEAINRYTVLGGEDDPRTLRSRCSLTLVLAEQGHFEQAETDSRGVLAARERVFGEDHPETLETVDALGRILHLQGHTDDAEQHYRRALEGRRLALGDHDPETLRSLNNVARILRELGRFPDAEAYFREAKNVLREQFGDNHPQTLYAVNNVGRALREQGRLEEAERMYREAMEGFEQVLGPMHPDTLTTINNMGRVLRALGRMDEAEAHYRRALAGRQELFGPDHTLALSSMNNLGFLMRSLERYDEAEAYFRDALEGLLRVLDESHPNVARATGNLGRVLFDQSRYHDAEPYHIAAIEAFKRAYNESHPETLNAMNNYVTLLQRLERFDEATELGNEVVKLTREAGNTRHLGYYLLNHARTLFALDWYADAEAAMLETHSIHTHEFGPTHARTSGIASELAQLYTAWHAAEPNGGYDQQAMRWAEPE